MEKTTEFSVLMSVYCKEQPEYLKAAVESVMHQTRMPAEVVLVEDGSLTEELNDVIRDLKYQFPILKTVPLAENVQLGRALAEGIKNCKYELIARMDTDDLAVENRFELQCKYMEEHPEVSVLGGYIEEFDERDATYRKMKEMPLQHRNLMRYARYRNPINHMTVMYRKSAICASGNYRHFPFLEDYDLWLRMLRDGNVFANLPQVLVRARTNAALYERRGGKDYCKRYLTLRKLQREYGLLTWREYQLTKLFTVIFTRQPQLMRKVLYRKALRK